MRDEVAKFLQDVEKACALVAEFTRGKSFEDFHSDALLRSAVERQFINVGEALTEARKLDATTIGTITGVRKIIGFRNILVHGYEVVKPERVWSVVEMDMDLLRSEVQALLTTANPV
jgi:uncharacterized protein with HEPN domain